MKQILGLASLSLLACAVACSGNSTGFGDDAGDDGATTDDGATDDGGNGDTGVPPPDSPLVANLNITNITVLQGVEVTIVKNAAPASKNAPIVVGRPAMVRVFVSPMSGWQPHTVTGVLTLTTGGQQHVFTAALSPGAGGSQDATLSTTFNFNVDAASIGTDTTYVVQLKDQKGSATGSNTGAQYPTSGTATALGAQNSGSVNIIVYPIVFSSGGGTPSTGSADVTAYQDVVRGMYPVTAANLTVKSAITYTGAIPTANGSNWGQLLNWFTMNYRAKDGTVNAYYYGAFAPSSSFASFCGGGCVAGLSNVPSSPSNYSMKASIGLVYGGDANSQQATGQTMAHEVGHGHGREHSPTSQAVQGCSTPQGIDPGYPYSNGAIGVLGYDPFTKQDYASSFFFDVMGYCAYDWISDYTYSALFDWVATDNGADMILPSKPTMYHWFLVADDGSITDEGTAPVSGVVSGTPYTANLANGSKVTGYFTPFDHQRGGQLLVPETSHTIVDAPTMKLAR